MHTIPAQLRAQVVHVDLYLLQCLPVQRLQPDALHQPLHSYSGDTCKHTRPIQSILMRCRHSVICLPYHP